MTHLEENNFDAPEVPGSPFFTFVLFWLYLPFKIFPNVVMMLKVAKALILSAVVAIAAVGGFVWLHGLEDTQAVMSGLGYFVILALLFAWLSAKCNLVIRHAVVAFAAAVGGFMWLHGLEHTRAVMFAMGYFVGLALLFAWFSAKCLTSGEGGADSDDDSGPPPPPNHG